MVRSLALGRSERDRTALGALRLLALDYCVE
jgi:hypothetical protein